MGKDINKSEEQRQSAIDENSKRIKKSSGEKKSFNTGSKNLKQNRSSKNHQSLIQLVQNFKGFKEKMNKLLQELYHQAKSIVQQEIEYNNNNEEEDVEMKEAENPEQQQENEQHEAEPPRKVSS